MLKRRLSRSLRPKQQALSSELKCKSMLLTLHFLAIWQRLPPTSYTFGHPFPSKMSKQISISKTSQIRRLTFLSPSSIINSPDLLSYAAQKSSSPTIFWESSSYRRFGKYNSNHLISLSVICMSTITDHRFFWGLLLLPEGYNGFSIQVDSAVLR